MLILNTIAAALAYLAIGVTFRRTLACANDYFFNKHGNAEISWQGCWKRSAENLNVETNFFQALFWPLLFISNCMLLINFCVLFIAEKLGKLIP